MNTAIQQIVPAIVIECGNSISSNILANIITISVFIPIMGVIKLTSPFSAHTNVAIFPIAQKTLARIGCQIIEISGIDVSKKIAGINTSPDNILFITSIDVPDNVFDCEAYFTSITLVQYNAAAKNGKNMSGIGNVVEADIIIKLF